MGVNPVVALASILFIALGGGASGALNMWYDADIDRKMKRTQSRPIPSGRVTEGEAFAIGMALSAIAVVMLALAANLMAGALLAFHHLLLRGDLHHVAETLDAPEHRDRRRRRGLPADDRLGRGHRRRVGGKRV